MDINDIYFINSKFCSNHSKEILYLYIQIKQYDSNKNMNNNHILNEYYPNKTPEQIINDYKSFINNLFDVSILCKYLVFIKQYQKSFPDIIDDIETIPNFTYEIYNISNINDNVFPDKSIVWDINNISPTLCGLFFENIITDCLNIDLNCNNLNDCLKSNTTNITLNEIQNIINRNNITIKPVIIINEIIYNSNNEILSKKDFKTKFHYMLFNVLLHFMHYDLNGSDYEAFVKIIKYINKNYNQDRNYLEEYYDNMCLTTFIKKLRKESNLQHSIKQITSRLHGEIDFISDYSIVDIKSYKTDNIDTWFAQLYLYTKLFGIRKELKILNVYTNKVISYKINY